MKKRLLTVLIVSTGIFFLYTSIVFACEGGHIRNLFGHATNVPSIDIAGLDTWSMKIQILGSTESIMNIGLIDCAKIKNDPERNKRGIRQILFISTKAGEIETVVVLYNDDSKDPSSYLWYRQWRRIRRYSKRDFENKEYEDTSLTLKEIMDAAVKLTDRDQVTIKDTVVSVMERIDFNKLRYH